MKFTSRKGFTLIELLVVIGILAVLAAIAIPSIAGLIDRANQSSDITNANEMTNAIERFTSEYELYCQDVASGKINTAEFDSMQGRVYNVTGIRNRAGVEAIESIGYTNYVTGLDRDTKYPVNEATVKKVIENYMKTSSSTFEPKQSDHSYYYSPQIGKVVVAPTGSTASKIDDIAKANGADYASVNNGELIEWINLSINAGEEQKDWNYNTFATDTKNVYTGYTTNAKYFNLEWTTEDKNGNPVAGSHHIKISNSYHEAECDTPGTMSMVPAGNYALRVEDGTWYYDYNILIYREGVQKFTLDTPSGKITIGTDSDEKPVGSTPSTPTPNPNPEDKPPVQSCQHTNTKLINQKEATKTEEGYTGDTWCNDCNTKIASGTVIDKLLTYEYSLSGKWRFNSDIYIPKATFILKQKINFITNTELRITGIWVSGAPTMDGVLPCIEYYEVGSIDLEFALPCWDSKYDGDWINSNSAFVDFGNTPQEVSKDFYDWFMQNAATFGSSDYENLANVYWGSTYE